ncbi:p53-like transcription factor [Rhizopus microsporus var. microsporus]|uniref:p53-like transcription factor n=2 Tax=Rhizopus microsporus TaxID=58291 RepID=A0A2G4SYH4_RHIZD|nr:p53-like transcription factor [Rhizopus microsporus ATCC 52813]ORE07435.1 p53-like transcription factor [Rhizopus microsporus var. microsporus]PHZ13843.1 p53-like transcription factor [Rhizopus microsporus ATCC 52813]
MSSTPLLHQRSHSMPVGNGFFNTTVIKDQPSLERLLQLRETSPFMTDGFFDSSNNVHNIYEVNNSDYNKTPCVLTLDCKMDRGFFFTSECHWTCYRRNYFQVSATLSLTGYTNSTFALFIHSTLVPIDQFYIRLKACISDSHDKPIALTQMTPKRDKGPQREPPMVPVSVDSTVTFERLQFKVATANNGKKRAAQQYFRLAFELVAQSKEDYYVISECYSQPLVVRGRSPGHYNADPLEPRRRRKLSVPHLVFMPPSSLNHFHTDTQNYFHTRSQSVNDSYRQESKMLEPPSLDDDVGVSRAIRNWREQRSDGYAYINGYSSPFPPSSSIGQPWPTSFRQDESKQEY